MFGLVEIVVLELWGACYGYGNGVDMSECSPLYSNENVNDITN